MMNFYETEIRNLTLKRNVLLFICIFKLFVVMAALWGMIEPWVRSSSSDSSLSQVANIAQTSALVFVNLLLIWFLRVMLRHGKVLTDRIERIRRGDVERGRFRVVDLSQGYSYSNVKSPHAWKMTYRAVLRNIDTGQEKTFEVDENIFAALHIQGVYEVHYIDDYPHALLYERKSQDF